MNNFTKRVRLGTTQTYGGRYVSVHCDVHYKDGELTISGVIGALESGNCIGSCGQIDDDLWIRKFAKGWDASTVAKFQRTWRAYHLNYNHAGTPEQEDYLVLNGITGYANCVQKLKSVNMLTVKLADGTDYTYGHGWLHEEVPEDVLLWLRNLPDADKPCAWRE